MKSKVRPCCSRREFVRLSSLTAAALAVPLPGLRAAFSASGSRHGPTTWGINTNIDVWNLFAGSVDEAIERVGALLLDLPCRFVREGLLGGDGGNNLDPMRWHRWFDPWVDWLDRHGGQLCLEVSLNEVSNPGRTYDSAWEKRVVHKCRMVAEYISSDVRRRRTVPWVMLINEPDLKVGLNGGLWTPERLVRVHELAWRTIKAVDPTLLIEGLTMGDGAGLGAAIPLRGFNLNVEDNNAKVEPGKAIPGMTSKAVIDLGITRYCDLVGFHSYSEIAEDNPFGARALVKNMRSAQAKFGFPIRPIVNTETGCHDTQFNRDGANRRRGPSFGRVFPAKVADGLGTPTKTAPASPDKHYEAIAHWQHLNTVQQARWGVARSCFYLLGGSPGAPWMQLADYPVKRFHPPAHYGPFSYDGPPYAKRPSFATAARALAPKPLAMLNGGFEQPEDKFSNWMVCFSPRDFHSDDLIYGEWKETHFLRDGDRTGNRAPGSAGNGYLRLDKGLPKFVRRVIDGLETGREYRVTAWLRQSDAAAATLAIYGFDQNQPGCTASAHSRQAGEWHRLEVRFVPRKCAVGADCWGVISLEHDGKATVYWDDVEVV